MAPVRPSDEAVEEQLQSSLGQVHYRITVDFSTHGAQLRPLRGVNKGVRHTQGANDVPLDYPFDYTTLYEACGISSARLHEGGFNVSNVFRAPVRSVLAGPSGVTRGVHTDDGSEVTKEWADWLGSLAEAGDGRGEMVYLDPHEFSADAGIPTTADPYLFWYPRESAAGSTIEALWTPDNLWYGPSRVLEAYSALDSSSVEPYFRFGEGNYGPTFVGPPGVASLATLDPMVAYAWVGTRFLQDLVDHSSGSPPPFVEFWNETFIASDLGDPEIAGAFVALYDSARERVTGQWSEGVSVGGFGFSASAMRSFLERRHSSFVRRVLERASSSSFDFLSYHWYGQDDPAFGLVQPMPARWPNHAMFDFADDLVAIDDCLSQLCNVLGIEVDSVHLSEWGLRLPAGEGGFEAPLVRGYNHVQGMLGAAFVSAGLTWMQNPDLLMPVERAFLWSGRGQRSALFHADLQRSEGGRGPRETEETFEPIFILRTPALAMWMHDGLDDDMAWVDVEIEEMDHPADSPNPGLTPGQHSAQDSATNRLMVTALAATRTGGAEGPDHAVVVTSLSRYGMWVEIDLQGFVPGTPYDIQVTSLRAPEQMDDPDLHPDTVSSYDSLGRGLSGTQGIRFEGDDVTAVSDDEGRLSSVAVRRGAIDDALDAVLERGLASVLLNKGLTSTTCQVTLPPFGIARIDITTLVEGVESRDSTDEMWAKADFDSAGKVEHGATDEGPEKETPGDPKPGLGE